MSHGPLGLIAILMLSLIGLLPLQAEAQRHHDKVRVCHSPGGEHPNAHDIEVDRRAVWAHLKHGDRLGHCQRDDNFDIEANRTYGAVGTVFELTAVSEERRSEKRTTYQWSVSDGRTFEGEQFTLSFTEPGFYEVTLTKSAQRSDSDKATIGLIVHEPGDQTPDRLGLPDLFADVNMDGRVSLHDALLTARFAGHVQHIAAEAQAAADMDRSGVVSFADANLISEAVLQAEALPDRLLIGHGTPGTMVTLHSHRLLDAEDLVQIRIGDSSEPQTPIRPVLGYLSFMVPFTGNAAVPGDKEVVLLVNGYEEQRYPFSVLAPEPLPAAPTAEAIAFLEELKALLVRNEVLVAAEMDKLAVSTRTRDILLKAATAGRMQADAAISEMQMLLSGRGGDQLAAAFLMSAQANGLGEYRKDLQAFLGGNARTSSAPQLKSLGFSVMNLSPDAVCDDLLPALCALQVTAELLDTGSGVVGTACDILLAAGLGAVVIPADGPFADAALLTTWATVCAPLEFSIDAAGVFTDLVSDVDADMRLSASTTSPVPGEQAIIKAVLDVFGLDDVCQIGGSAGASKLVEKLTQRMVNRMIMRKITVRAMHKIFQELGEDYLQKFLGLMEDAAKEAITKTGIDKAILEFAQPYCEDVYGAELVMNASRVLTGPNPNEGTLTFNSDGTAAYSCPTSPSTSGPLTVAFTATKEICDEEQTKKIDIQCTTRDVTITMGDNGSANDDIYEVRLNGQTVLTTSSPVRSVSVTVQMPVGSTAQVQMLGRAAPDGIGTYFIRFSGARVISGSTTSGTDLVPGAVKNFTIEVLP